MRKYLISSIFIIIGITLLLTNFYLKNHTEYPETIFAQDSHKFEKSFSGFINSVNENNLNIKSTFNENLLIRDYDLSKDYFLNILNNNDDILSISFLQNNYKLQVYKSKESIVIGVDSTEELDIVQWKRYKNNKLISKWDESFEVAMVDSEWFKNIVTNNNQIHWLFNIPNKVNNQLTTDNNLFYSGYSYKNQDITSTIVLSYSRMQLLEKFDIYRTYDQVNLLIETKNGDKMNLGSGITETFKNLDSTNSINSFKDSLIKETLFHYNRFSKQDSGIFSFAYKENTYWNSFKKYNDDTFGVKYFLLSVPSFDIVTEHKLNKYYNIEFPLGAVLLLVGLVLLFVNKSKFYQLSQKKIPSLKLLLIEDENRYLEFKSSMRWDYRQEKVNPALEQVIFKTIAAFGNTDGGILIIGVDDDKNVLGLQNDFDTLKKKDADYFEIHLRNLLHTLMGVKYVSSYIRMKFEIVNNKTVCKLRVLKAKEPLFLIVKDKNGKSNEKFYVRSGNSSQEIESIGEINDYINEHWS
ncbi:MAG: hypothetical protein DRI86_06920 [Bacteroidetes bacterium]|nr:MAG: hypothetical protein DRI86_06920 [Bacteroidota bacterium]